MMASVLPISTGRTLIIHPHTNTVRTSDTVTSVTTGGVSTSNIVFQTQGINRIQIDEQGHIGIGKATDPFFNVDVEGNFNCTGLLSINGLPITAQAAVTSGTVGISGSVLSLAATDVTAMTQVQKILPPDAAAQDFFSHQALAMTPDCTTMIVGAPERSDKKGKVYIYSRDPNATSSPVLAAWVPMTINTIDQGAAAGDLYGSSVDISYNGTIALVGAAGARSAYVYVLDTLLGEWNRQPISALVNRGTSDGRFGSRVCMSQYQNGGYYIVISEPMYNNGVGRIHMYFMDGTTYATTPLQSWSPTVIGSSTPLAGFSLSMSYSGASIAVGAPQRQNASAQATGAVFMLRRSGSGATATYTQEAEIFASTTDGSAATGDYFGYSVSVKTLTGRDLVVGAPFHSSDNGPQTGAFYTYRETSGYWMAKTKATAPDIVGGDRMGISVALDETGLVALVGAIPEARLFSTSEPGAYLYHKEPTTDLWAYVNRIAPNDGSTNSGFGQIAALGSGGASAVVGSYANSIYVPNGGAVYWMMSMTNPFQYNPAINATLVNAGLSGGSIYVGGQKNSYLSLAADGEEYMALSNHDIQVVTTHFGVDRPYNSTLPSRMSLGFQNPSYIGIVCHTKAAGAGEYIKFLNSNQASIGTILTNFGTNVSYMTSSDYRLKHDVKPINQSLSILERLKPVLFKWNETNIEDMGFIAHEVQEVLPNVVHGRKDGPGMQAVDYAKLTPLLCACVQELVGQVTQLKAEVAHLKAQRANL